GTRRRRVVATTLQEIGTVHTDRPDPDPDLPRSRDRGRHLPLLQDLRPPRSGYLDRTHSTLHRKIDTAPRCLAADAVSGPFYLPIRPGHDVAPGPHDPPGAARPGAQVSFFSTMW